MTNAFARQCADAFGQTHSARANRDELGVSAEEFAILRSLTSPPRIQSFLNELPSNWEETGETLYSVRSVLAHRRAHCMEAAMLAACALWVHGEPPLLMHMGCARSDYPHVVALFRRGTGWGAISKANGISLRFRDPVYRGLRELAMSYFHEYADESGRKTLRTYSRPFDLRRLGTEEWVTSASNCWLAHDALRLSPHSAMLPRNAAKSLVPRDAFEIGVAAIQQYRSPQ